jgi:hypothetical protein
MSTSSLEAASWLWAERGIVIMLDLAGLAGSAFCL